MTFSQLKFDVTEKVALRVHSSLTLGKQMPAEIASLVKSHGLNVIAITDRATVDGIPETVIAGEKLGVYVIPGIEIESREGIYLGYFIDYQNEDLLKFIQELKIPKNLADGTSSLPSSQEVIQTIANAGGLPIDINSGNGYFDNREGIDVWSSTFDGAFNTVLNGDILPQLQEKLPDNSLHKEYFKRMYWRSVNLSPEEFAESLQPKIVKINKMEFEYLVNTVGNEEGSSLGYEGYPFIIIRGESLEKVSEIKSILEGFGCYIISEMLTDLYREIAWRIYKMGDGSAIQRTRDLLKFNLDHKLYGEKSAQCLILFFQNPGNIELRKIKKALRTEIGSIRFYRLEYQNYIDMFFTSFVHIPDEQNIQYENWILYDLGISVPAVQE